MPRRLRALLAVSTLLATAVAVAPAASGAATPGAVAAAAVPTGRYVPTTPTRVLDTRLGRGPVGPGGTVGVDLTGSVSATAVAAVLTVTVTEPTADGFLTVYPARSTRPEASNLNKLAGETRSNSVTVSLPQQGSKAVDVFNQAGSSQVVVDLLGWYDTASGDGYEPLDTAIRYFDSRETDAPLAAGEAVELSFPPPFGGARAVAVNITAIDPEGPGYLTAWDGLGDRPGTSTVNFGADPVTPTFAVIPAYTDDDGVHITLQDNVSATDVAVDVLGFYNPSARFEYQPVSPLRISDTRRTGILGPAQRYDVPNPPADADQGAVALNLNVTAVDPSELTFLTVWSAERPQPGTSDLNPLPGRVVANVTQVRLFVTDDFAVYNALGFVNVVVDLEGYFVEEQG